MLPLCAKGGKDRTGVAVALVLGVAGIAPSYISHDYALTRLGIEPVREMLLNKLTNGKPLDLKSEPNLAMLMRIESVLVLPSTASNLLIIIVPMSWTSSSRKSKSHLGE